MGIFDFFLKGPELTSAEAEEFSTDIALILLEGKITIQILMADAEGILEKIALDKFPNNSIKPEQSRQILRCSIMLYEQEKNWLEKRQKARQEYLRNPYKDIPLITRTGMPYSPPAFLTLTLFK